MNALRASYLKKKSNEGDSVKQNDYPQFIDS